jgi:hypothetical protein
VFPAVPPLLATNLPPPNETLLVFVLLLLTRAVVHVNPFNTKEPVVNVMVPANVGEPDKDSVMSDLLIVDVKHVAVAVTVTVAAVPLFASKFTVSADVGLRIVGTPPEEAANCVFPLPLQVPVPPTQ